jgi:hypothetical protein
VHRAAVVTAFRDERNRRRGSHGDIAMPIRFFAGLIAVALTATTAAAAVKFTSTWVSPEARAVSFKGQKVVALVVSQDLSLRMSAEEALGRELSSRGIEGVAAYRTIPAEELKKVDRAKAWFQKESTAGVVMLRPVSQTTEQRPNVVVWTSSSYATLWEYYPYSWGAVYAIGPRGSDTRIVVETVVFDVASGKLVWGGVSEAVNPKSLQTLVADIAHEAAQKIQMQFR